MEKIHIKIIILILASLLVLTIIHIIKKIENDIDYNMKINEIIADDIVSNNDNELGLLVDDSVDNDFVLSEQLDPVDDDWPGY